MLHVHSPQLYCIYEDAMLSIYSIIILHLHLSNLFDKKNKHFSMRPKFLPSMFNNLIVEAINTQVLCFEFIFILVWNEDKTAPHKKVLPWGKLIFVRSFNCFRNYDKRPSSDGFIWRPGTNWGASAIQTGLFSNANPSSFAKGIHYKNGWVIKRSFPKFC